MEREGPVQTGLIHLSSFTLIINVIQHQVSNAKSTIDHRPDYVGSLAKGKHLFFSDDVWSHAECKYSV